MRCLGLFGLGLITAVVAVGVLGASAAMPAQTTRPHAHYTLYIYKAKVGVKGGTNLSNAYSGTGFTGDVKHESSTSSFSIDANIRSLIFYTGKPPSGAAHTSESGAATTINGTWTDQGEKWLDPVHGTLESFTCGGKVASTAPPGNMSLTTTRGSSKYTVNLRIQTVQMTNNPPDACPNDSRAPSLGGIESDVYRTQFSIPKSKLGKKKFAVSFSGPLAKYRSYLSVVCSGNESGCSYNMAWHGNVHFTRTRMLKVAY